MISSAAFDLKFVSEFPQAVYELQIGGTSAPLPKFVMHRGVL